MNGEVAIYFRNGWQLSPEYATTILLIVHSMLGYRRLREMERYKEDPIV